MTINRSTATELLKQRPGILAILVITGLLFYRAAQQSITFDEAESYFSYVSQGPAVIFTTFHSNNHAFNSFLEWVAINLFGLAPLSLRFPAVLGGLLYLFSVEAICNGVFRRRANYILTVFALAVSPFILDYAVVARGYSLALGLFLCALFLCWHQISKFGTEGVRFKLEYVISALCALSVSSNLAFAFINTSLLITYFLLVCALEFSAHKSFIHAILFRIFRLVLPGAIFYLATSAILKYRSVSLYFGSPTWAKTYESLVAATFDDFQPWLFAADWPSIASEAFPIVTFPIFATILFTGIWLVWSRSWQTTGAESQNISNHILWGLLISNLVLTIVMHTFAHYQFGLKYPRERTGIYFVPLLILTFALSTELPGFRKWTQKVSQISLVIMVAYFLLCFRVHYFRQWKFNAGAEHVFQQLVALQQENPQAKIVATWRLVPSLNFYRDYYNVMRMEEFSRNDDYGSADILVLLPEFEEDSRALSDQLLEHIYTHPTSGIVILRTK